MDYAIYIFKVKATRLFPVCLLVQKRSIVILYFILWVLS